MLERFRNIWRKGKKREKGQREIINLYQPTKEKGERSTAKKS